MNLQLEILVSSNTMPGASRLPFLNRGGNKGVVTIQTDQPQFLLMKTLQQLDLSGMIQVV